MKFSCSWLLFNLELTSFRKNLNSFFNVPNFNAKGFDPKVPSDKYACIQNDQKLDWLALDTFIAVAFTALTVFLVLGTLMDLVMTIFKNDQGGQSFGLKMLLSFSLYSNWKSLMSTRNIKKIS